MRGKNKKNIYLLYIWMNLKKKIHISYFSRNIQLKYEKQGLKIR